MNEGKMPEQGSSIDSSIVERVVLHADLRQLSPSQKVSWYRNVCESLGLNYLTQPFAYIVLNNKEVLYAKREATEQLRRLHHVSVTIAARELLEGDLYVVSARATLPDGRCDENIGVVSLGALKGEMRANAMMKAETKAKRRVTLSICGLGMLDETEVETLPPSVAQLPEAEAEPIRQIDALEAAAMQVVEENSISPGALFVRKVESAPTKNPKVRRYRVTFSSGEEAATISDWVATLATQYMEQSLPVAIKTKATKWGNDLVSIKQASEGESLPLEEPPSVEDIPF
jgi:hypothetical protein